MKIVISFSSLVSVKEEIEVAGEQSQVPEILGVCGDD